MSKNANAPQTALVFLHISAAHIEQPNAVTEMLLPLNGTRFEYDEVLNRTEIHLADGSTYVTPRFIKRIADCIRGLELTEATVLV